MTQMQIKKAIRQQRKARIDLTGPSGSGKTYTALTLASGLGKRILLIDSERASASLFADQFEFDTIDLPDVSLQSYFDALKMCKGYDVYIIDSLSHAWEGVNEEVQNATSRSGAGNSFQQWGKVGNPLYAKLLSEVLSLDGHAVCTMRVKTDYVMEEYTVGNKTMTRPKKVGLAPKFREGGEYEFDVVANLDLEHNLIVEKTRLSFLDGKVINKPGKELGEQIAAWLSSGAAPVVEPPKPLTNNDGGVRPAVTIPPWTEGNPWLHLVEGACADTGTFLCNVNEATMVNLADAKFRKRLVEQGALTEKDRLAIYWALKTPAGKAEALKEISDNI